MARESIIDLGEWAEDRFAGLCSRSGVTRNKSIQDRTGWDYLIEFPPAGALEMPTDLRPIGVSARVQVKSKRAGSPSIKLKLSHAIRFAKDPLPCFVVLMMATDGQEPVRIYAKHFWEDDIARALKRAREAHAEGRDDLHRLSLTISFGAQDEHTGDLIEWMQAAIAELGERYHERKAELARTLGFEDGSFHGNIEFRMEDLEALVDHQIGLTPSAPTINITLNERRFGIDRPRPLFEGKPDHTTMRSHPQPCRLRIRGVAGNDVWLDGELFRPGIPELPLEYRKLRVVADFVEIVISATAGGSVTLHLDGAVQRSLPGLRALSDVLWAAEQGPLHFQISGEDLPTFPFAVSVPAERGAYELQQLANVIACLEKTTSGLLPADLTLSLDEIDNGWNAIVTFNGMVAGTDMKGQFTLDRGVPETVGPAKSIFLYDYVDIGSWTFMAVVRRPIDKFEIVGVEGVLECGDPRVVEAIVRRGRGAEHISELRDLYLQAYKLEGSGVLEMYGGSHRAMIEGSKDNPMILHTPD